MSRGKQERKEPFKSKCCSGMCWGYFMVYGVIYSISMSTFVKGALSPEIPLCFSNPLMCLLIVPSYHIYKSPFMRFQAIASPLWDSGERKKGRVEVWTSF